MKDASKTKAQLIEELAQLRQRIAELEDPEAARRQTDKALAEERNLLRTLIDALPDNVYVKDTESRYTLVNEAYLRFWGAASPDDILGKSVHELFPEEVASQYYADDQKVMQTGQPIIGKEEPAVNHTGRQVGWDWTSKVPLRNSDGKVVGLVGVDRDITERKRIEEALAKERNLLRTLIDAVPDYIYVKDAEARYTLVNAAYQRVLGTDVVGKTVLEVYPEEPATGFFADDQMVLKTGQPLIQKEEPAVDRSGRTVGWDLVTKVPLRDSQGEIVGVVGISRNITEHKRAEEAIRQSEQLLRSVMDATPDWIFAKDRDFRYVLVNKSFASALDTTPEEMIGKDDLELGFPEELVFGDPERGIHGFRTDDSAVLERGEALHNPYDPATTADGQEHIFDTHKMPLRNQGGEAWAVLGFARDITERKQAEEALAQQAEELARSNKELEQFAYVASHDLQEPLRMVSSYTQLLAKRYQGKLDADADEFIAFAVDGASRMQALINDLLAFSRVGTRGKEFAPTDCEAVFEQALVNLRAATEESGAVVTRGPLPTVMADDSQLVQLFQNLLSNAIKFRGQEPPQIHLGVERKDTDWLFSVRDNGIGFDAEKYAERVFIIFQRLHGKGEYSGTGIGLAICKKIVERHGGHIWAESQPGEGSTFYFTLPANGKG